MKIFYLRFLSQVSLTTPTMSKAVSYLVPGPDCFIDSNELSSTPYMGGKLKVDEEFERRVKLEELAMTNGLVRRKYPNIKRGDIVICVTTRGTRNEDILIYNGQYVIELERDINIDHDGYIPKEFKVSDTEFHPSYWSDVITHNSFFWPHQTLIDRAIKNPFFGVLPELSLKDGEAHPPVSNTPPAVRLSHPPVSSTPPAVRLNHPPVFCSQLMIGTFCYIIFFDVIEEGHEGYTMKDFIEALEYQPWADGSNAKHSVVDQNSYRHVLKVMPESVKEGRNYDGNDEEE